MDGFDGSGRRMERVVRMLLVAGILLFPASMGSASTGARAEPPPLPCDCGPAIYARPPVTTWGGPQNETAEGVAVAPDGSVYIAGVTDSFGAGRTDVFVLKLTSGNRLVWQRTWGGSSTDTATGVAAGPDGSAYVTGTTSSFGPGNPAFLLRFAAGGALVWQRTWGGVNVDFANAVAVASDGSAYVVGQTVSFGSVRDAFIVKFSAAGDLLWQRIWGGPTRDAASAVAVGPDGSVYVAGQSESFSAVYEITLLKFAPDGTLVFQELWSRGVNDFAQGIAVSGDGSVYVAGIRSGGSESTLLKFAADGTLLWQRLFNEIGTDAVRGVAVLADGSVFLAGWTDSFGAGLQDELVLKVSALGDLVWAKTWGGPSSEEAHGIAAKGASVEVAGLTWSAGPYRVSTPSSQLTTLSGSVRTPSGILATPSGVTTVPGGIVGTPAGSTRFAGATDATVFSLAA